MNKLPPLPLIGGSLFIDNSFIEALTQCARACEYSYLVRKRSMEENAALNFGTALHLVWDWRYHTLGSTAPDPVDEQIQIDILTKHFMENPPPLGDFRTLAHAVEANHHYNQRYGTEPFSILADSENKAMVEKPFATHFYDHHGPYGVIPVHYTGKIDLVIQWDDLVWVMDHKTTSQLGKHFFDDKFASSQLPGYCWALEQTTNLKPAGYAINALRSKPPPKKLADGTYTDVAKWWKESLARERAYLRPGQLNEWRANAIHLVDRFIWHHSHDYMPMETSWCFGRYGRCPFRDVCDLPEHSRGIELQSTNYTDNTWSPLVKPK